MTSTIAPEEQKYRDEYAKYLADFRRWPEYECDAAAIRRYFLKMLQEKRHDR